MNTHVKITQSEPADLSRRSFLVGTAAAGLALGYSAVPGLLGADYTVDRNRYRFAKIYNGQNWTPSLTAPLTSNSMCSG